MAEFSKYTEKEGMFWMREKSCQIECCQHISYEVRESEDNFLLQFINIIL